MPNVYNWESTSTPMTLFSSHAIKTCSGYYLHVHTYIDIKNKAFSCYILFYCLYLHGQAC